MKNELPKTLQKLISRNKLSARKVARDTGISISTISDILNGRQPSLRSLQTLSRYFDVSLDYLVNGSESKKVQDIDELDFEDFFEGIVKIKISKLKTKK